jgi:hypothetical protein
VTSLEGRGEKELTPGKGEGIVRCGTWSMYEIFMLLV